MKKFSKIAGIALVLVAALALFSVVTTYAQGPNPAPSSGRPGQCGEAGLLNIDQEAMHAAIADALGITVAEFEAARADGTPLFLLAQELGVDIDIVQAAMRDVREAAIDEALAAGTITEAQAEWMRLRPTPGGYGAGMQNGYGYGMQGGGHGRYSGGRGFGSGNGMFSQG